MTAETLIEVRDAVKRYGGATALKSVSLHVRSGTVHGLLGENGAGKSTLVRIIAGLTPATSGSILFAGLDVGDADVRAMEKLGVFLVTQEPMIVGSMTVADNLMLGRWPTSRRLREQGVSFLFISHYNEEILEICDEVSVLRDGRMIAQGRTVSDLDSDALSEMVIGRDVKLFHRTGATVARETAWSLRNVTAKGLHVDRLDIREGEIIGFAGLPGSGARELGRAIFGLLPGAKGHLEEGKVARLLPRDPAEALRSGIAFLSEDRLRDGVIGIQSVAQNMSLSCLSMLSRNGFVSGRDERKLIERFSRLFAVKAQSPDAPISSLSGGNQQKVLLSRLVATEPRLLILNEPTRGIDVGVKEEVHRIIDGLTRDGVPVIVITSDLDEMLRVVDRVAIFVDGRIASILPSAGLSKDDVFAQAFSTDSSPANSPRIAQGAAPR